MKIILAGSPESVVDTFEAIIKCHNVVAIITQPDKKQGRGLKLKETAVASLAKKYHIQVFKPIKIKQIYNQIKKLNFDLLLTFAYGQFFPSEFLKLGQFPPINIHASLLPKYRGAAPIHYAILNGDKELGISLIEMIDKMDAGNIYFQAKSFIDKNINVDQATKIISHLAKTNINKWLQKIENKNVVSYKQPDAFTYAPKIPKSFGLISDKLSINEAKRKIKGLTYIPGAFVFIDEIRYKVFDYLDSYKKGCLRLVLKDGTLFINDFQKENKKRCKVI